jgi:cell division protein FtsQ
MNGVKSKTAKGEVRKRKWKATLLAVIFFVVVATGLFLQSPLSKIRAIQVRGAASLDPPGLIRASGLAPGLSLFKIRPADVERRLESAYPLVASAGVQLSWNGTVTLVVKEKKTAGVLLENGMFYRLLEDGTVLDRLTPRDAAVMPIITDASPVRVELGKKIHDSDVLRLCAELVTVDPKELAGISEIHIGGNGKWIAYTRDHFELRLPDSGLAGKLHLYEAFRHNPETRNLKPGVVYLYENDTTWYDPYPAASPSGTKGESH